MNRMVFANGILYKNDTCKVLKVQNEGEEKHGK